MTIGIHSTRLRAYILKSRWKDKAIELAAWSNLFRLLSDPTRVRLLKLLERDELTVAELAAITRLAQPRVSTHLARLREAGLVSDRRSGVSAYYRFRNDELSEEHRDLWATLGRGSEDPLLREDADRLPEVLRQRADAQNWADTVAGDMERHYSPGRTWETLARASVQLLELGDVLDVASGDGVTAELLAGQARQIVCIDASERVVEAAAERLARFDNVVVQVGDMHCLDFADDRFDVVLLLHALTYAADPARVLSEAARVLKPGGRLLAATLLAHRHEGAVAPFDHANLGFTTDQLESLGAEARLTVLRCGTVSRERRPPHFEVITLLATKR